MNWFNFEYEKLFHQNILKDLEKFKISFLRPKKRGKNVVATTKAKSWNFI